MDRVRRIAYHGFVSRSRNRRREEEAPVRSSPYIVSRAYDWFFFILPPLFALALGIAIAGRFSTQITVDAYGKEHQPIMSYLIGIIIHAHLVAVLVRSHNNRAIFNLYPIRFTVVPVVLWFMIAVNVWIAVAATVVATFWDVWHSGAQTFGLARIYDRNSGTAPETGRRLDLWLNQFLYLGPILAGVSLIPHLACMEEFASAGSPFLASVPVRVAGNQRYLTWAIIAAGTAFLVFYLYSYWRLWRNGYRPPFVKVFLLVSTGFCSIYTWGFNTWGEAFFIMNLFHAWQYLALVWWMEHKRIMERLRVASLWGGKAIAAVVFFGAVFAYGYGAVIVPITLKALWAITIVVSLMHFWYDGFVWSVRKGQV